MSDANVAQIPDKNLSNSWMIEIVSGLIIGLIHVIYAISLASLVFTDELAPYLDRGIAIALVTSAVVTLVMSLRTRIGGLIGVIQDSPVVLIAVAIGLIVPTLESDADLLATVVMLIVVSTVANGASLWLIGHFNLGNLIRYIPYPVIGGFLAGTGWLLVQGSIGTMADYNLTSDTLSSLLQAEQIARWLPGIIFGFALFYAQNRFEHFLTMPVALLLGLFLLYGWILLAGSIFPDVPADVYLIGGASDPQFVSPLPYEFIFQADWLAILQQVGSIGAILIMTPISLLLYVSALELTLNTDIDFNRELKNAGITNLVSGGMGGLIGYHSLSLTVLNRRIGGYSRKSAITASLLAVALLFVGPAVIGYLPQALLGGLLFYMGMDFFNGWVIQGWKKFSHMDFAVVLVILVVIAFYGYLAGMGVGLGLMVVLFAYEYSQIDIFHHRFTGAEVTSNIQRNTHHQNELRKMGKRISVMELKGYIFFATANRLLEEIRTLVDAEKSPVLDFLVLDFRRVSGLDSSASHSFNKIASLAQQRQFEIIITHISDESWHELLQNGLDENSATRFDNLDYGLEYCEDELLARSAVTTMHLPMSLKQQLKARGFSSDQVRQLKTYLEKRNYQEGDYLIRQGDDSVELYFIEIGQASVFLEAKTGSRLRIQTLGVGTIVGELGFILGQKRSASVMVDRETTAYALSREALQTMKAENPELAIEFSELMLRVIADRLVYTNGELVALNR